MCVHARSVTSDSLQAYALSPPDPSVHGVSPGKNTGVCFHAFLKGIFPTQGSNPGLSHDRHLATEPSGKSIYIYLNLSRVKFQEESRIVVY